MLINLSEKICVLICRYYFGILNNYNTRLLLLVSYIAYIYILVLTIRYDKYKQEII